MSDETKSVPPEKGTTSQPESVVARAADKAVKSAKAVHAWSASRLVDDWKQGWKWISTWVFGLFFAVPIAWLNSPTLQSAIPPKWMSIIAPAIAVIGFLGRMYKQGKKEIAEKESAQK